MDISRTIRERRSIRKFNTSPVAREQIVALLNQAAGMYEAEGTPRWRCVYYDTFESRRRLGDSMLAKIKENSLGKLVPGKLLDLAAKQTTDIPAHLAFIAEAAESKRQIDENYAAVCSIMQNFQLLGWESGLGMIWYTEPMVISESFYKEIGMQEGERYAGLLSVGYFDKTPKARKRTPAERKWTEIGDGVGRPHSGRVRVDSQSVLDILNEAVWAPNDGLREPWRFVCVTGGEAFGELQALSADDSSSFLLVVAKEEADPHKREEDYAAVCCLVQNFQLLAKSKAWRVRRTIPDWVYDRERCKPFGIRPQEQIVAVLALGGDERRAHCEAAPPAVNVTCR